MSLPFYFILLAERYYEEMWLESDGQTHFAQSARISDSDNIIWEIFNSGRVEAFCGYFVKNIFRTFYAGRVKGAWKLRVSSFDVLSWNKKYFT